MKPNIMYINRPHEALNGAVAKNDASLQRMLHKCFDADADKLVKSLADVATDGFGKLRPEADVRNHVLRVDRLYLAFDEAQGRLAAFSSYNYHNVCGKNVLYLCGTVVRKEYQQQGFFGLINRLEIANSPVMPDLFVGRTQNPIIYSAMSRLVRTAHPNGEQIPEHIKNVGMVIARDMLAMPDFDPDTFVGRGTYGECLYDEIPYSKARPFFDKALKLDYKQGDSVLVVGELQ